MSKLWLILLVGTSGLVLAGLAFLFWIQRSLQYFPTKKDQAKKGDGRFEPFLDEHRLFLGYFLAPLSTPEFILIVFHGNGGEAIDRAWIGELVEGRAICILAEYPGYGGSEGKPTQTSILERSLRIFDTAKKRWPGLAIRVIGESLGTGPASYLVGERDVDRLGLIAPFSSAADVAQKLYPYLPIRWLMRDRFPSVDFVRRARAPLHVVHGTLDDLIPIELGRHLYESYPVADKEFTEVLGFGHNGLDWPILHSPFCEEFRTFITGRGREGLHTDSH